MTFPCDMDMVDMDMVDMDNGDNEDNNNEDNVKKTMTCHAIISRTFLEHGLVIHQRYR